MKNFIRAAVALNLKEKSKSKRRREQQAGRLASSQVPAISHAIGEHLSPAASYAKQLGVEAQSWTLDVSAVQCAPMNQLRTKTILGGGERD